jgi:alpha-glucosidase
LISTARTRHTTTFWAEGGEMNYYFLYGPSLPQVSRAYARLTGTHELPPLWALGYHQCRWSYYPHSRVMEIADTFRELEIPCDAIYLDIDYMDGYRCFTWNREHFPDPKGLIDELRSKGFQTVLMIDPGIKEDPDYAVYQDGLEKNAFLRSPDGELAKGPVWPGFCAFPDFTDPEVRHWWGDLYTDLYQNLGVAGFWNDMNEPAVFHVHHKTLPDHVLHHYEGLLASHRKAHNIYGQQMNRASWEGFRRLQPEKRPYLLTRASYSGGQRFAAVWTGDNFSDWESLPGRQCAVPTAEHQRLLVLRHRYRRLCRQCRRRIVYPLVATGRFPSADAGSQHGPARGRRCGRDR